MRDSAGDISVIVPCLNAERTLAEALDSLRAQTVPPREVLLIDDGSDDRSVRIARSYAPWVRVLRNRGRGPGAARRLGVEEACGAYVAFVDADDWLAPTKHEAQLAAFARSGPDIVVHTDAMLIYEDGSRSNGVRTGGEAAVGRCTQTIFERNPVCGASCMLRRETILQLGNYDADLFGTEDYGMSLAASTRCDFVHLAEPLYWIRRHDSNVTRRRARMTYFHWLAQERFRINHPRAFTALPAEAVERCMIQPVLREAQEAYWRRETDGYAALLRLAHQLRPTDPGVRALWHRRWLPMTGLRAWDRLSRGPDARADLRSAAKRRDTGATPHLAMMVCHPGVGGMERFTRFLAENMLARGWRVTVGLSGENIYQALEHAWPGRLCVQRLDWLDRTFAGDREYEWRRIAQRRRWFRGVRPDVALFVQSSNTPFRASVVGAALARVPIVTTHRTMAWPLDDVPVGRYLGGYVRGLGLHRKKMLFKTRLTALLARCVVFNSHEVRGGYESIYRYPTDKGRVISNAVEARPASTRPVSSAPELTVGFVGRLAPEKRLDVLLHAVAGVPGLRLALWGEGPSKDALASLAAELGIGERVVFHGHTNDVWPAYEACDVVALCSPRESSSNMILEAMAAGKAVVAPRTGGMAELVDDGRAGLIVPPLNAVALSETLRGLVESPVRRHELGLRAAATALARHDPRAIGQRWHDLFYGVAFTTSPAALRGVETRSRERLMASEGCLRPAET